MIEQGQGEGRDAVFNQAFALLYRLNELLSECNRLSRIGAFIEWKRALDAVYRETAWAMSEIERKAKEELLQSRVLPALRKFQDVSKKNVRATLLSDAADSAYTVLAEYEIFLRDVQSKHGLVMPSPEDPRFAIKRGRG